MFAPAGLPARDLLVRGQSCRCAHTRVRRGAAAVRRGRVDEPVHEDERRRDRCSAAGRPPGARSWRRRSRAACAAARRCPSRRADRRRRTGSARRASAPAGGGGGRRVGRRFLRARPAASARPRPCPGSPTALDARPPRRPPPRPNATAPAACAGSAWRAARRGSPTCSRARCRSPPRRSGAWSSTACARSVSIEKSRSALPPTNASDLKPRYPIRRSCRTGWVSECSCRASLSKLRLPEEPELAFLDRRLRQADVAPDPAGALRVEPARRPLARLRRARARDAEAAAPRRSAPHPHWSRRA